MNFSREIGFLVASIAAGIILHLIPYNSQDVAIYRFDNLILQDTSLREVVVNDCATLVGNDKSAVVRQVLRRFANETKSGTTDCRVQVEVAHTSRFFLRDYWNFLIFLHPDQKSPALVQQAYPIEIPRPLTLLPLAMFLLALIFEFRPWGFGWTLASYVFLLSGGNFIQASIFALRSSYFTLTTNQTFIGLTLITLWLSLLRSRRNVQSKKRPRQFHGIANRILSVFVGLWNPMVFTVSAKLFLPFKGAVSKLEKFFDGQMMIIALSLYLLSVDFNNFQGFLQESVLIPRYFTFAAVIFLGFKYLRPQTRRPTAIWDQSRMWRGVIAVVIVELLSTQVPLLRGLPTIIRVGISLVLSELVTPRNISPRIAAKTFSTWMVTIFCGTFIFLISTETGITDLAFVLWEPRMHPTAFALFTFLAGMFLGFLTGNFSTTFFTVYTVLLSRFDLPLAKAALIDGILAGSLLSPFSLFNLLPAVQFGISVQDAVRFRFRQISMPLCVAVIIYAVCAINSVAILQPVTFIFLVMVGVFIQLKKSSWKLTEDKSWLDSRNAPNSP